MALEIAGFIGQLDENFPGTTDQLAQGDDHIRMLKAVLKATFPGRSGADSRVLVRGASFTPSANEVGAIYACSAALTVSMPALGGVLTGANYIVHASAGNVTLTANGTELLNGVASMTLSTGGWALLAKRSGAEWTVLASFPKQTGAELVAAIGALPVQAAANGGVTSVNGMTGAVTSSTSWDTIAGKPTSTNITGNWALADQNNLTYLWGTNDKGNHYPVVRASLSVNYANSAGNADTVDGYHYHNLPYLPDAVGNVVGALAVGATHGNVVTPGTTYGTSSGYINLQGGSSMVGFSVTGSWLCLSKAIIPDTSSVYINLFRKVA